MRYKFNCRQQEEGELIEHFLADIQQMIKNCNYCVCATCKDSILKDKIVLGVRNATQQTKLLKMSDLSLNRAIDMCKASESDVKHDKQFKTETVNKVRYNNNKLFEKKCADIIN